MRSLLSVCLAVLLGAGCATTKAAPGPSDANAASSNAGATAAATKSSSAGTSASAEPAAPQISTRAQLYFDDANKAYEAQRRARSFDYAQLEAKYKAALDADPKLAEAEYDLGVLADRQGKTEDAVRHYQAALRTKPSLKQATENLAIIEQNRGNVPAARRLLQSVIDQYPDDASSRAQLAGIERAAGNHEEAMALARQALMRDPKNLAALKAMMLSYLDRKQFAMAKLVALQALKINDADPELHHTIGLVLMTEGDDVKAAVQFKKAVEAQPDYLPSRLALARLAIKAENYTAAEEHLRKILQVNGKSAEAHLDLGVAYKEQGQFDKAMQEYDAAEKLNPKLAAIYLNRAIILHRHKDAPERAIDLYKKYLSMSGEGIVPADAPVLGLVKECEAIIQAKAEAKAAEEQAKKLEEAKKQQEAKNKEQNAVKPASGQPGAQPTPAVGTSGNKVATPATTPPAKNTASAVDPPAPEKKAPVAAPVPETKPAPTPAPKKADPNEPKDEPSDGM